MDKIGYVRVSTKEQDPDNQIRILQKEGIPLDYIFVDKGISGSVPADQRPGFRRAMEYADRHKDEIKFLYVYEISRLGRTFIETLNLISDIEKRGIMVWSMSPNEGFMRMPEKSIRDLLVAFMAWIAQREKENLIERTKAGIDRARSQGKQIGRPRFDIDIDEITKMRTVDKKTWDEVERLTGYSYITIRRALKRRGISL